MKIIYIATATNERGDTIQENAYTNADLALAQAVKMCGDINRNTDLQVMPDVVPLELFEEGDVVPEPTISSE